MSLIVSLLTVNAASTEAVMGNDMWSRLNGEAHKTASRGPSPFRASPNGRMHLFGAH